MENVRKVIMGNKIIVHGFVQWEVSGRNSIFTRSMLAAGMSQAEAEFSWKQTIKESEPNSYNIITASNIAPDDFVKELKKYLSE